jgi:secreted Zn-dependent insulinase-like peptidase
LAALKEKSWATGCYAGLGSDGVEFASSHALFTASFTLSEEGMKHWEEVVTIVFSYIGMLRHYCDHDLLPEWIQEELRLTCEIAYRYSDEEDPVDFVERLADRLAPHFKFPSERLLDGRDLVFDYDERAIQNLLDNYFTPKNVRIDLMSSNYGREGVEDSEGHVQTVGNGSFDPIQLGEPLEEPMFGTHYWCHDIPDDTLEKWDQAAKPHLPPPTSLLNLPPKNPYIPVNLGLKSLPADDGDHPLLNSSLKLCVSVGKQKVRQFINNFSRQVR